ncbi:MAG: hypothetical protein V4563_15125 [Pseudomonadota bacterium]
MAKLESDLAAAKIADDLAQQAVVDAESAEVPLPTIEFIAPNGIPVDVPAPVADLVPVADPAPVADTVIENSSGSIPVEKPQSPGDALFQLVDKLKNNAFDNEGEAAMWWAIEAVIEQFNTKSDARQNQLNRIEQKLSDALRLGILAKE